MGLGIHPSEALDELINPGGVAKRQRPQSHTALSAEDPKHLSLTHNWVTILILLRLSCFHTKSSVFLETPRSIGFPTDVKPLVDKHPRAVSICRNAAATMGRQGFLSPPWCLEEPISP